ncbi:MAG TPA: alpha/beta fold hydrolase, partial [Nitriliruptorales bacterium]|nr:alpha/beta fold hydrolase [Nitriliruptorales bacterium]
PPPPGRHRVMLLGFSFGGSLCLLAGSDGRLGDRLAGIATFGAYFDLVGVLQAATTGVSLVDGQRVPWDADPRAHEIVRDQMVELLPPAQRRPAREALDGDRDPAGLPPAAQGVYALVTNREPARTSRLASRLPQDIRDRVARMSPATVSDRLHVPIVAMHASDDPTVPYGELRRLGAALPHAQTITVDSFDHVDLELSSPGSWLRATDDLWNAWRFATTVLDRQDGWWP